MFITNNHNSFHLWWYKNFVKHQNVSKYDQDCRKIWKVFNIGYLPDFVINILNTFAELTFLYIFAGSWPLFWPQIGPNIPEIVIITGEIYKDIVKKYGKPSLWIIFLIAAICIVCCKWRHTFYYLKTTELCHQLQFLQFLVNEFLVE